ncbi:hypothetical protein ACFVUW_29455 [Streptomyces xiamenensis]
MRCSGCRTPLSASASNSGCRRLEFFSC